MPNRLLLLSLFFFFSHLSFSQYQYDFSKIDTTAFYRVYFFDGTFLKAKIQNLDDDRVYVQLETGQELSFNYYQIKGYLKLLEKHHLCSNGKVLIANGWYKSIGVDVLIGDEETVFRKTGLSIAPKVVLGYFINNYFGLGLGTGFVKTDELSIPLFIDGRFEWGKSRITPNLGFQIGYAFPLKKILLSENVLYYDRKPGLLVQPSVGIRLASSGQVNSVFKIGYNFQYEHKIYRITKGNPAHFGKVYDQKIWHQNLFLKYEFIF